MKSAYCILAVILAFVAVPAFAKSGLPHQIKANAAQRAPKAQTQPEKPPEVLIRADQMSYDANTHVVTAEGKVEVTYGERTLVADKLTYDQNTRIVTAIGRVSLKEADGTTIRGNKFEVTDDMRDGVIESLNVVLAGRGNLAAGRATRSGGNVMTLERAVYSTCQACKDDPSRPLTWQIKAFKVIYDKKAARVEYEDAYFEIAGIPVLYLPYFSHADPSSPRQSGFLVPGVGHSTDIGYFFSVPYYFALDPSYDLTVTPEYTENDGPLLKGDWRQRTQSGSYELTGSVRYGETHDNLGNGTGEDSFGSHLFGTGRFQIDNIWRWGFDLQMTSNDTYLKRYDISSLDRLVNNAFVEGVYGRSYASVNAWYFEGLRATDDPGTTPLVMPLAELEYVPDSPVFGGRFSLLGNLLVLQRGEADCVTGPCREDTNRLSATANWSLPITTTGGHIITFFANMRADVYYVTGSGALADSTDTTGRVLPLAGVEWRYPLVSTDGGFRQVIEPIVQAIVAPYGGNPNTIPNEDSASFEFDDTNLFSINKFPGEDRVETGPRMNAGLRYSAFFDDGMVEAVLGESFRLHEDDAFSQQSGLRDQSSDYVGSLTVQPTNYFRLINRFRIAHDDGSFERNEVYAEAFDVDMYSLKAGYLKLAPDPTDPFDPNGREEVSLDGRIKAAEYWWIDAAGRRNLEDDKMIESRFGIAYEDECAVFGIDLRRRFTRDRDIEPATSLLFTFRLKGLN
ncbi:MAG: LPS assembly protein LptD [Alphaproteobacteria bacterium]|nr:LPS assembly protein LptD [Alphaproteobacteria bacterium]